MIATSVLDGDPEALVTLPAHSWWPLVLAVALGVGLLGALVDQWWLFLGGVAGIAVSVGGWLWSREEEVHL